MFGYTYLLTDNNNNNNNLALKRGLVRKSGTPTPDVSFFNYHQFPHGKPEKICRKWVPGLPWSLFRLNGLKQLEDTLTPQM